MTDPSETIGRLAPIFDHSSGSTPVQFARSHRNRFCPDSDRPPLTPQRIATQHPNAKKFERFEHSYLTHFGTSNEVIDEAGRGGHMKRRKFIALIGGVTTAFPLRVWSQQAPRRPIIGVLSPISAEAAARNIEALRAGGCANSAMWKIATLRSSYGLPKAQSSVFPNSPLSCWRSNRP